jgi:predicted RNase H-like nuclease (RuvC/YqgF family)
VDKATMEKDQRYTHSNQMMEHTVEKIRTNRHLVEGDSDPMARLWFAMNQKFYKKILWWEQKYKRSQNRIKELEAKLAERRDTILQLEAMLGIQHENEKRESAGQQ